MPAGDASRTWFPEMLEMLRAKWHLDLTFIELIALRDELDAMLHCIRSERNIHAPVVTRWRCGHVGPGVEPEVSVRGMILSLGRFGIAPANQVKGHAKTGGFPRGHRLKRPNPAGSLGDAGSPRREQLRVDRNFLVLFGRRRFQAGIHQRGHGVRDRAGPGAGQIG
jgi:hypothetical protein